MGVQFFSSVLCIIRRCGVVYGGYALLNRMGDTTSRLYRQDPKEYRSLYLRPAVGVPGSLSVLIAKRF